MKAYTVQLASWCGGDKPYALGSRDREFSVSHEGLMTVVAESFTDVEKRLLDAGLKIGSITELAPLFPLPQFDLPAPPKEGT